MQLRNKNTTNQDLGTLNTPQCKIKTVSIVSLHVIDVYVDLYHLHVIIDETSIHYIMRAVEGVKADITDIARALRLKEDTIKKLQDLHRHNLDRLAISLMDTWLRGDYIKDRPREPYSLHAEGYQGPSWWNLVWAVKHSDSAHAEKIAKNYKTGPFH